MLMQTGQSKHIKQKINMSEKYNISLPVPNSYVKFKGVTCIQDVHWIGTQAWCRQESYCVVWM